MRLTFVSIISGALGILSLSAAVHAQEANTRIASMPYADCLAIIAEASGEIDEQPVRLVDTSDQTTVRIPASDGFVTVSCSRSDNQMMLTKSPVPEAAGMSASR
ncbi:hypothetical protein AB4Y85_07590 [Microvirga sp. 2YAF29]|uniref:hypothetical protein n=1 Tax=Microvirga sp. 2YAF29 TaxID=3233031 RepID=UPI003F9B6DFA